MLTDDELPLPEPHCTFRWKNGEYKVNRPGIDGVDVYTARQMREYARAVEQAAYAAAIKACEGQKTERLEPYKDVDDEDDLYGDGVDCGVVCCVAAIRSLMTQEQPK